MPGSLEEAYEKTKLHREKFKEFEKLFKSGVDGRIILFGRRVVVFGSEYAFGDLYKEMEGIIGPPINTLLYRVGLQGGFNAGRKMSESHLAEKCSSDIELVQIWGSGVGFYFGWGIILVEKREDEVLVRSYNGWEAESYLNAIGKSDRPMCHFTRGFMAGGVGAIILRTADVRGEETKCMIKGDPYCEFAVKLAKNQDGES